MHFTLLHPAQLLRLWREEEEGEEVEGRVSKLGQVEPPTDTNRCSWSTSTSARRGCLQRSLRRG